MGQATDNIARALALKPKRVTAAQIASALGYTPAPKAAVGTLSLSTSWSGSDPYTQVVTSQISGVTDKSKIDLQPDAAAISQMISDGVTALYAENNNGAVTVYALGAAPTAALSVQYTREETE